MKDHNPNAGENQTNYSGGSGGSTTMSAGVADGLSSFEKADVKNAENVSQSQRPEANSESSGSFRIGTQGVIHV